ncbi:hypothetical protein PIB30_060499 [Stylosanthes scabra]|uniref:Uncharacterized protein n=1 Tax=Stylosanthes scabra TaxID=79078 RepID=A0ABU6WIT4_9FABA|nr:hypothetical protein [Stylosanthes scabra]
MGPYLFGRSFLGWNEKHATEREHARFFQQVHHLEEFFDPTVLSDERVDKVDSRYVLERWSKNVKRNHTNIRSSYDEPVLDERRQGYNDTLSRCFKACQVGSESKGLTAIVHRGLDRIFSELQEYKEEEKEQAKEKGKQRCHMKIAL